MSNHRIPRGRRRALDRNKKRLVCDAVSRGATMGEAAQLVGVSLRTVQREARMDPDFDQQLRIAHNETPDPLAIMHSAARTHWRAAAWLLERTNPEEYGRKRASCCTPFQFDEALKTVIEAALRLTPPENRAKVYAHLTKASETAFKAIFPNYGPWGSRLVERLPSTPLADAEHLNVLRESAAKSFIPDPLVPEKDAPEASPERAVAFAPTVPNGASDDKDQEAASVYRTAEPTANEASLANPNQHPEPTIKHPAKTASASDAPNPTPNPTPTLTPTRISSRPSPQPPTEISRLPWRYILRSARTAKSLVPDSAPGASSLPEPVLSHLSPKTRVATEFTDDTTPLAAPPHSASPSNPVE